MAGKDLTEWMAAQPIKEDTIGGWFDARPDIARQAKEGKKAGLKLTEIAAWLKDEHDFPFSPKSISPWLRQ